MIWKTVIWRRIIVDYLDVFFFYSCRMFDFRLDGG